MTAYRLTVVHAEDLAEFTIVCSHCGARLTIRFDRAGVATECSACGKPIGKAAEDALEGFARFQGSVKLANNDEKQARFEFHIRQNSSE